MSRYLKILQGRTEKMYTTIQDNRSYATSYLSLNFRKTNQETWTSPWKILNMQIDQEYQTPLVNKQMIGLKEVRIGITAK